MAFQPRSVVREKKAFGETSMRLTPADGIALDDHRFQSAMFQHRLAGLVREWTALRDGGLAGVLERAGDRPGLSLDRQRRWLRGETTATFADLAFWCGEFPVIATRMAEFVAAWNPPKPKEEAPIFETPALVAMAKEARPPLR